MSRCFWSRRERGGRGALCSFSITGGPFQYTGWGGDTEMQEYKDTEIQEREMQIRRKGERVQCSGFPLLEAFPIQRGGVYCCLIFIITVITLIIVIIVTISFNPITRVHCAREYRAPFEKEPHLILILFDIPVCLWIKPGLHKKDDESDVAGT